MLGFAEADPTADADGDDAADKLSILVREAFGAVLPPAAIARRSLSEVTPEAAREALARGEVLKQVGRCRRRASRAASDARPTRTFPVGTTRWTSARPATSNGSYRPDGGSGRARVGAP